MSALNFWVYIIFGSHTLTDNNRYFGWIFFYQLFKVALFPVNKYGDHHSFWTSFFSFCCSQFEFLGSKHFWKYSPRWISLKTDQSTGNVHLLEMTWTLTGTCYAVSWTQKLTIRQSYSSSIWTRSRERVWALYLKSAHFSQLLEELQAATGCNK